jgi:hypothetical protein
MSVTIEDGLVQEGSEIWRPPQQARSRDRRIVPE